MDLASLEDEALLHQVVRVPLTRSTCGRPCPVQLRVPRHSEYATVGEYFKMECPVIYCAQRPNVMWCKYSGGHCLPLETGPWQHTGWEDKDQGSVFTLHFEPVYPSDNGSYSCSIYFNSEVINSNIIALHVTDPLREVSPVSEKKPHCFEMLAFWVMLPVQTLTLSGKRFSCRAFEWGNACWCGRLGFSKEWRKEGQEGMARGIQTRHKSEYFLESRCSGMDWNQMTQSNSLPMTEINTTLFIQMGAKALLCCPAISMTEAVLISWVIAPRGQPPCRISYRVNTKNNEANCTDRRITWASTPDQSPDILIDAVALDHDGLYSCEIITPSGNIQKSHDLQVLVPPAVTLIPGENRTAVCEAIAGKPAVQIFWTPDGDHITKKESHSNGTVTVRSTYHWEQKNVSAVFCFVSHPTGNQTLFIELNQGVTSMLHSLLIILYVKFSLIGIILLILGFVFFLKR
ncbi:cell surface glycoprotein CD200 receptor 5-like, partial [Arvicola amphibius]|uniref:cell surface glycoprotein CD200 receptor 5-like n=1 Tax=Arvicola amphibius TaxID=1047088 RepID=UPI001C09F5B5